MPRCWTAAGSRPARGGGLFRGAGRGGRGSTCCGPAIRHPLDRRGAPRRGKGIPMAAAGLKLGWIGTGRMGYALVSRLLQAGHEVAVYNRTRAKAEPLTELGARAVDRTLDLADSDVVFSPVAASADFRSVT